MWTRTLPSADLNELVHRYVMGHGYRPWVPDGGFGRVPDYAGGEHADAVCRAAVAKLAPRPGATPGDQSCQCPGGHWFGRLGDANEGRCPVCGARVWSEVG